MKTLALHQEYINRHKLQAQLFLYNPKTCLFLRRENASGLPEWRILAIQWRMQDKKPSFFEFNYSQVIFDEHLMRNVTKDISTEFAASWYWEQYEKNILKLASVLKSESIKAIGKQEELLAAWEVFLLIADSLLVKCSNKNFHRSLEISLRKELSIEERKKACYEAQSFLGNNFKEIYNIWHYQIFSLVKNNDAQWLANLIND